MVPSRVIKFLDLTKIQKNHRFFTEGFLGTIIPDDDKYRKMLFGECGLNERRDFYFYRTFNKKDKEIFKSIYG